MRLKELMKIANKLDSLGLTAEADILDKFMRKVAEDLSDKPSHPGYATYGYPGGDASKRKQGFLYSSPKDLAEFNNQLADLFELVPRTSEVVSLAVLNALPRGETTWGTKTNAAFAAFCSLVGEVEASKDWQSYANNNNYEPTIAGVIKFWNDNKEKANTLIRDDLLKAKNPAPPSAPPSAAAGSAAPTDDWRSGMINYNDQRVISGGPAVPQNFKRQLYAKVTGGSGVSGANGEGITGYTRQIMTMINGDDIGLGAKQWFAQEPEVTLPWGLAFPLTQANIDLYLKRNYITNSKIKEIYGIMLEANEQSKKNRENTSRQYWGSQGSHP